MDSRTEIATTRDYSYRTLIGHGIWTFGEAVAQRVNLSPFVLHLFYLALPTLGQDEEFVVAWKRMHEGTGNLEAPSDDMSHKTVSRSTRFQEFGLIVQSLYRMGIIAAKNLPTVPGDAFDNLTKPSSNDET